MKILLLLILSLQLNTEAFSASTSSGSEFELEKGLVDRLYQESTSENTKFHLAQRALFTVTPTFSVFNAQNLILSNNYFEVPYSNEIGSIPSFSLIASSRLARFSGFSVSGLAAVGYSLKESLQRVNSKTSSSDSLRTTVTLHWLPISLGSRIEYGLESFPYVRSFIVGKVGGEWFYQVGNLDGLEQGFWIPFLQYGGGLTFFDNSAAVDSWFGGISFSISKHLGLSSSHKVDGIVLDLGMNLFL